jgi:multidrug efflux pump
VLAAAEAAPSRHSNRRPCPVPFGLPIQFAIKTTEPASRLNEVSTAFLAEALKSGEFMFFDTDLKYDQPQSVIEIDRDKTAQLGLTMSQVGTALGGLLGGGYVNYFSMDTRSYKVIPQVERVSRSERAAASQLSRSP